MQLRQTTMSLILWVEMFSVDVVTFAFWNFYSVMITLKMSPVLMLLK